MREWALKARDLRLLFGIYIAHKKLANSLRNSIVCWIRANVRLAPGGGGVCSSLDTFDRAPSHHFRIYGAR